MKKISIIIPCYNEEENILPMHKRLTHALRKTKYEYEIIFVNNGSTDNSADIFYRLAKQDKKVIILSLSRNFYKSQGAYTAGIDFASGDAAILIDGDLQDPPEKIPDLLKKWEEGYDIVYGVRVKRKESIFRKVGYKLFYRIFRWLSYIDIPVDAGDFSLIDKKIINVFKIMPEKNRYIRGLRAWVGFKSTGVPYTREERYKGFSTNSFIDNVKWALLAIFSFSYAPLGIISWLAIITVVLAACAIVVYTALYFIYPLAPRGFQTLLLITLFLGSIQLICFSIIAQYLGIIFEEIKGRPKYIIEKIIRYDTQK